MCKIRHFKAAHRSVPYNSLGIFYSVTEQFFCLRSDIHAFPSVRDLAGRYGLDITVIGECIADPIVNRKKKFYTFVRCFFLHIKSILQIIIFAERSTDLSAFSFGECISHSAADDQCIYLIQQVVDNGNLAGNFCSAKDSYERSLWIVDSISKEIDLFLHQIAYDCGIYVFRNTYVRAVCSVGSTKSVVYKYVAQGSQFFGKFISVFGLLCTVTGVLQ